ncbi:MAG: hypothetical protein ACP5HG_17345 [Anaerolineae bacterium]
MKLSDVLFGVGIVIAVVGAIATFFPMVGVGLVVFVAALLVRQFTKPAESQDVEEEIEV